MGKRVGLVSLGCPKNLVDSEVMLGFLERAGYELTGNPAEADVIVVNTCAFIEPARQESIDAILEMAAFKQRGRCRRLIVAGCLSERYRHELRQLLPEVDVVLGTNDVPLVVAAIKGATPAALQVQSGTGQSPAPRTLPSPPSYLYDADTPRVLATPGHYAYVKVAEGCDYACSFCIIPKLRGRYRSRPAESIVKEARMLADRGVRELILVSQDTSFYGVDRGERGALARLLRALDQIDSLAWIRLLYLYPTTITDDTLAAIAECDRVCKYIDLPLQHVSARVLKRMRRPGGRVSYERLIRRIRTRIPGVTLRTTLMVGFPGETPAAFAELAAFVRTMRFDHLGVFTYSHEEGTTAWALGDTVPARVKRRRQQALMRAQQAIVRQTHRSWIGQLRPVLVDGPMAGQPLVIRGRLESQAPEIDPVVYLTEVDPATCRQGELITVRIVAARGYDLVAVPIEPARATAVVAQAGV